MSYHMNQLSPQGSSSTPHHGGATEADEVEYDRLRRLAREEAQKRGHCFERSRAAYEAGDGAAAHTLSEEGKQHGANMDRYNAQARDYIFRANNAHQPADTIDLHGLYVEEAEEILSKRIQAARGRGESYLNVIVGKGNHSVNHVTKIKPAVEKLCRDMGLQFEYDQGNAGKMVVNLGGAGGHGGQQQQGYQQGGRYQKHNQQQQQHQQQQYPQQQQQQQYPQQQQQQQQPPNELEELAKKAAPIFFKKLQACCIIM